MQMSCTTCYQQKCKYVPLVPHNTHEYQYPPILLRGWGKYHRPGEMELESPTSPCGRSSVGKGGLHANWDPMQQHERDSYESSDKDMVCYWDRRHSKRVWSTASREHPEGTSVGTPGGEPVPLSSGGWASPSAIWADGGGGTTSKWPIIMPRPLMNGNWSKLRDSLANSFFFFGTDQGELA